MVNVESLDSEINPRLRSNSQFGLDLDTDKGRRRRDDRRKASVLNPGYPLHYGQL